jgi:hypothetical protein
MTFHRVFGAFVATAKKNSRRESPGTAPSFVTAPTISQPVVGVPCTITPGTMAGIPAPTPTWQWLLDGANIVGATNLTYTPVAGDVGHQLSVRQTASNGNPPAANLSSSQKSVATMPGVTANPVVLGTPTEGTPVAYTAGTYSGSPAPTFVGRQWQRFNGTSWVNIAGATGSTYTPTATDVGTNTLRVQETFGNVAGNISGTSTAVSVAGTGNAWDADYATRSAAANWNAKRFLDAASVAAWVHPDAGAPNVVWDPYGGVQGKGCARINHPENIGTNPGALRIPYNSAWTSDTQGPGGTRPGPKGTRICKQWRQKFSTTFHVLANGSEGPKMWINGGYNFASPNSSSSHSDTELVGTCAYSSDILQVYRELDPDQADGSFKDTTINLNGTDGSGNIVLQPGRDRGASFTAPDDRYCLYPNRGPGCFRIPANEWLTFVEIIEINTMGTNTPAASTGNYYCLYILRDGETSYNAQNKIYEKDGFQIGVDTSLPNWNPAHWFTIYDSNRIDCTVPKTSWFDEFLVAVQPTGQSTPVIPPPQLGSIDLFVPTWRSSMAVGEFKQIAGSNLSAVNPVPQRPGNTGPGAKVHAWTSFPHDPDKGMIYPGLAGGHQDYGGNEVNAIDVRTNAPKYVEIEPSSAVGVVVSDQVYYSDGKPSPRHHFQAAFFDPWTDVGRLLFPAGAYYAGGQETHDFAVFDLKTMDYLPQGTYPALPNGIATVSSNGDNSPFACTQDPRNGNIYAWSHVAVGRFNRLAKTWTDLTGSSVGRGSWMYGRKAASAWDSARNRILFAGGDMGTAGTYTPSTNTFTQITLTGPAASAVLALSEACMIYVPAPNADAFFLKDGQAGGTVYRVDASTFNCTVFSTSGGSGIPALQNSSNPPALDRKMFYMPRLGGFVLVADHTNGFWFLRVH